MTVGDIAQALEKGRNDGKIIVADYETSRAIENAVKILKRLDKLVYEIRTWEVLNDEQ